MLMCFLVFLGNDTRSLVGRRLEEKRMNEDIPPQVEQVFQDGQYA